MLPIQNILEQLGLLLNPLFDTKPLPEVLIPLHKKISAAHHLNHWFDEQNCIQALKGIHQWLTPSALSSFFQHYALSTPAQPKTILLITPSNIPFAGFHDVLCVLASGHHLIIKPSSNDAHLLQELLLLIKHIDPIFHTKTLTITDTIVKKESFDAVIATGSNNTSRYFEAYFGHLPHIIRKNRNSLAILSGNETSEELQQLGLDIFTHYGLGCRNITHLLVPEGYSFNTFFEAIEIYKPIIHHGAYSNNYTYHKALFSMNLVHYLDNNFLLLREDEQLYSPIGTLYYSYYKTLQEVETYRLNNALQIQCTVSNMDLEHVVPLGTAQEPSLFEYADQIDTLQFLLTL